jgi:hypothetical protein
MTQERNQSKQCSSCPLRMLAGDSLRVRCVTLDGIPGAARQHGDRRCLGHSTDLASKDKGESSMLKTQRSPEDMYGEALQDPHPMAVS